MSFTNSKQAPQRFGLNSFVVQDQAIAALDEEDHYRYVGIPIGLIHNIDNLPDLVDHLIPDLIKIEESLLALWQKLDTIKTFIQPSLTYALRVGNPRKQSIESYRSTLICVVRKICDLPTRASTYYIFASKQAGGLGFQDPTRECDIQTIV